ncbi:hypothetical protein B0H13DRAFT_1897262 [Mycena leptocephala]|nr:hypothetical protein B0H13DRAFT_1897262 [Mycena leptocephala]
MYGLDGQILAAGRLPPVLRQVLQNPRILKVSQAVAADLKYLQEASNRFTPVVGAVNLARFAKDHLAVTSAKIGLADLTANIIVKRLNKNISERISTAWEWEQLSESQLCYAALDVYACSCLYDSLTHIPIPSLPQLMPSIGIRRSPLVPAAIITTHGKWELSDFGPISFKVVCLRSHLRLSTQLNFPSAIPPTPPPSTAPLAPSVTTPNGTSPPELTPPLQSGENVLGEAAHNWGVWKTVIRSRVLKDAFHIFNMFYISVAPGLRVEFARALRDAIFIPDPVDKARMITWGRRQNPGQEWDTLLHSYAQWLWPHCKRIIPPPEELYPLIYCPVFAVQIIPKVVSIVIYSLIYPPLAGIWHANDVFINPRFITGLANGNLYQPTKEVAGVLPVSEDIRVKYGMARFEPSLDATWPHHHLAALQGGRPFSQCIIRQKWIYSGP